ncbi:MAG TPA: 2-hydroxyacid dehydrogenase [Streptosporangiaceae bacterium]|jgi:D-3-phosphoglycerate dehydrogenase
MTIACLSPMVETMLRDLAAAEDVELRLVPPAPAPAEMREICAAADIVVSDNKHRHPVGRDELAVMRRCRLLQQAAVGFDVIDEHAAAELGIPVANATGYNRESVADLVVMGAIALLRNVPGGDRDIRAGRWIDFSREGRELGAMTVGIIGVGNIGTAVASRMRAFGCRVIYHDVAARGVSGAEPVSQDDLLARADVVTVHVPLDASTRGLIGEDQFARMRPGTVFVNTSRGPVVDQDALAGALRSGRLRGAYLDVFAAEPLPSGSPLREMENVLMTPHVGGFTREALDRLRHAVEINIRRVLAGQAPLNVVNGTAWNQQEVG